jgi:Flp pilus assembly protein TadG
MMNDARKTSGQRCTGSAGILPARGRNGARGTPALPAGPGQAMAEFAIIVAVLLGLTLAVIDLARAGFMQHDLDGGAATLARSLAAIAGTNSSASTFVYTPTVLSPTNPGSTCFTTDPTTLCQTMPVSQAIPMALAHAAQIANYNFNATPPLSLGSPVSTTLTNGQVTVVATPDLTNTTELTVTITAPFTPVVGFYLNHSLLSLQARSSTITPWAELGH